MKKIRLLPRLSAIVFLAFAMAIGASMLFTPSAHGQSREAQEKIRLMSSALRARDAGDLNAAKENLEELLRRNPDDANIQRMLDAVNQDIERQAAGEVTRFGQAAGLEDFTPGPQVHTIEVVETETVAVVDSADLDALLDAEATAQKEKVDAAKKAIADARQLIRVGRTGEAQNILAQADAELPINMATVFTKEEIRALRGDIILERGRKDIANRDPIAARLVLEEYVETLGEDRRTARFEQEIRNLETDPWRQDPAEISPEYVRNVSIVDDLLVRARAQVLYGDLEGASQTLREVEARDPTNAAAKALQIRITEAQRSTTSLDVRKTRAQMLQEVSRSWQRPQIFDIDARDPTVLVDESVRQKLANIEIPRVSFAAVPISRVVETLSELSVEFDDPELPERERGVNMVLYAPRDQDPPVSITLRNLSLDRILDFTLESVGFTWDVRNDVVEIRRGTEETFLETEFFPISRGNVIRLSGGQEERRTGPADPFAPATGAGPSAGDTESAIRSFFQRAGVDFEQTPGSSLAFDGTQLIVTQTPRNLERMRNILRRYDQPKQVEIEAKFLEVQQGALDELGFRWNISGRNITTIDPNTGAPIQTPQTTFQTTNRSLQTAFSLDDQSSIAEIISPTIPGGQRTFDVSPPSLPSALDLGSGASSVLSTMGIINGADVQLMINALSRQQGSDLLSSPRLTVLSGRTANIVVAQELRYPERYGDADISQPTGGSTAGSPAAIGFTSGTPDDFQVRNIGVEMEVTPTVEENENISLRLEPRVTEFEGFVEYGGPNVALAGNQQIIVPSGFYQPIFSTRSVRTEVTIYDGATVVIGGLTREEIKTINDKVPILGDIPLIGRLFQNKGESSLKRNLLIFVTANLISPGGSPQRQRLRNVEPNALFQNPIIVTPGGGVSREVIE